MTKRRTQGHSRPALVRPLEYLGLAAAVAAIVSLVILVANGRPSSPAAARAASQATELTVAAVPAGDSAGFFVAMHDGLFKAQGIIVHFVPAISSETVIAAQAAGKYDVSCGNYVSYIQAQERYNLGQRSTTAAPAANLDIFAEGSLIEPATQAIYVMPGSRIGTLADLEGKTIAVNAPANILYLLAASALSDHGLSVPGVHFAYIPFPAMATALKTGKVAAAVLPEPFASQDELSLGVESLADLDQGATVGFPIQGCVVTKQWAARNPRTLTAFRAAFEQGQELADTNRLAVEHAFEALPAPFGLTPVQAAVMSLDDYPVGPVDVVRLQRVADVMREFLGFPPFNVRTMVGGS